MDSRVSCSCLGLNYRCFPSPPMSSVKPSRFSLLIPMRFETQNGLGCCWGAILLCYLSKFLGTHKFTQVHAPQTPARSPRAAGVPCRNVCLGVPRAVSCAVHTTKAENEPRRSRQQKYGLDAIKDDSSHVVVSASGPGVCLHLQPEPEEA